MDNEDKKDTKKETSEFMNNQDWLLEHLTMYANYNFIEMGITLYVNGLVVTGNLIGGKKYFEHITGQIGSFHDTLGGLMMEKENEIYQDYESQSVDDVNNAYDKLGFIHLEDAKVLSCQNKLIPSGGKNFWRGKISSVDGFMLGKMKLEQNNN